MAYTAKSIIIDIADGWGHSTEVGLRSVDFFNAGTLVPLSDTSITCYSTTQKNDDYSAENIFNTSLSKLRYSEGNEWSSNGSATNQRVICVFDSPITFDSLYMDNSHSVVNVGDYRTIEIDKGAQNIIVRSSVEIITDTTYNAAISNSVIIYDGVLRQHHPYDKEDPVAIVDSGASSFTAKSIIVDIADNYGGAWVAFRAMDFFRFGQQHLLSSSRWTYNPSGSWNLDVWYPSDFSCDATTFHEFQEWNSTDDDWDITYSAAKDSFNSEKNKINDAEGGEWASADSVSGNQRVICVLNDIRHFDQIEFTNSHNSGELTNNGAKNIKVYVSTDSITSTVYGESIENATLVFDGQVAKHVDSNVLDSQELLLEDFPDDDEDEDDDEDPCDPGVPDFIFLTPGSCVPIEGDIDFSFQSDSTSSTGALIATIPLIEMSGNGAAVLANTFGSISIELPGLIGNCAGAGSISIELPWLIGNCAGATWAPGDDRDDTHGDVNFSLPILGIDGHFGGDSGPYIQVDIPVISIIMATPIEPITASVAITFPSFTAVFALVDPITGDIDCTLPVLDDDLLAGTNHFTKVDFTLPAIGVVAKTGGYIELDFPVISVEVAVRVGLQGSIIGVLPSPSLLMYSGGEFQATLPSHSFTATADTHVVSDIELFLPIWSLTGHTTGEGLLATLPTLDVDITGDLHIGSELVCSLPSLGAVSHTAGPGLAVSLPSLSVSIESSTPIISALSVSLPAVQVDISAFVTLQSGIEIELPVLSCQIYHASTLEVSLPAMTSELEAETPITGSLDITIGAAFAHMAGLFTIPTTLEFTLPGRFFSAQSVGSRYHALTTEMPKLSMTSHMVNNGVSDIDIELPALYPMLQGFFHREGGDYIDIDLPMIMMLSQYFDPAYLGILRHVRGDER